jgi:hypothetical protein
VGGILIEIRKRKVDLLKEELTGPGSEVAFIVKAQKHWRNPGAE